MKDWPHPNDPPARGVRLEFALLLAATVLPAAGWLPHLF